MHIVSRVLSPLAHARASHVLARVAKYGLLMFAHCICALNHFSNTSAGLCLPLVQQTLATTSGVCSHMAVAPYPPRNANTFMLVMPPGIISVKVAAFSWTPFL